MVACLFVFVVCGWAMEKRSFNLPPDLAERSLRRFSAQSGIALVFPSELTRGARTREVQGDYTPREALDLLLLNSGLVATENKSTGVISISAAARPQAGDAREATARDAKKKAETMTSTANTPRLLAWLTVALAPSLSAQSTSPTANPDPAKDATITLSPFEVRTDKDVGYLAANTLSGSRLNTSLFDTPASISELTPEFLADINANDINAAVNYSLGFENDTPGGNDNVSQFQAGSTLAVARGLGRSRVISRDYFPLSLNHDAFSLERISQSRGPNAILFGLGNAGGIINTASKRAHFKNAGELGLKVDDDGGWRVAADYNRKLSESVALRVNLLKEDQRTWRELEYTRSERIQLASTWRPLSQTKVSAQYERGVQDRLAGFRFIGRDFFTPWLAAGSRSYNRLTQGNTYPAGTQSGGTNPILVMDSSGGIANWQRFAVTQPQGGAVPDKFQDETYMPASAVLTGPANTTDNDMWIGTVLIEHEIVKNLFVELGYNEARQGRDVRQSMVHTDVGLRIDPNQTLPGGAPNPHYGQYYIQGAAQRSDQHFGWRNWRATLAYEWDSKHRWIGGHRWVGLATSALDWFNADVTREANLTPLRPTGATALLSNAQNTILRRTYLSRNGIFGDNGVRAHDHDPFNTPAAPVRISDAENALTGTVTPGFFRFNKRNERADNESMMLAGQSKILSNRLVVTYGWRWDTLDTRLPVLERNPTTNEVIAWPLGPVESFRGNTRTLGAVVPVVAGFALYANQSDNFSPQNALDLAGNQIGNVQGTGRDIGVKLSLGGNKLYARAGHYKTATTNQSVRIFTESTQGALIWEVIEGTAGPHYVLFDNTGNRFDGQDDEVEGYEFEVTANPTRGLSLTANYATLEGQTVNIAPRTRAYVAEHRALWAANASRPIPSIPNRTVGQALADIDSAIAQYERGEGQLAQGNYKQSFNAFARYRFQEGPLRNWSAGAGARYRKDRILGFAPDRSPIYSPSFTQVDASLAYQSRLLRQKLGLKVQLNVSNLLNNTDLQWTNVQSDGTLIDYTLPNPRKFTLTTTLSF